MVVKTFTVSRCIGTDSKCLSRMCHMSQLLCKLTGLLCTIQSCSKKIAPFPIWKHMWKIALLWETMKEYAVFTAQIHQRNAWNYGTYLSKNQHYTNKFHHLVYFNFYFIKLLQQQMHHLRSRWEQVLPEKKHEIERNRRIRVRGKWLCYCCPHTPSSPLFPIHITTPQITHPLAMWVLLTSQ